jgi:very-short-patch-repair endonuclease
VALIGRGDHQLFVDGPHHDSQQQAAHDREAREELRDRGYRVIAIRHDRHVVNDEPTAVGTSRHRSARGLPIAR